MSRLGAGPQANARGSVRSCSASWARPPHGSECPWAFAKINGAATVRERSVPLKNPALPPASGPPKSCSAEDQIYTQRRNPRLVWLDSVFALFVCVVAPLVFLVELPGAIGLLLLVAGLFTFLRSKVSPKYVTRRLVDTVPSHSTQAPWEPFEKKTDAASAGAKARGAGGGKN